MKKTHGYIHQSTLRLGQGVSRTPSPFSILYRIRYPSVDL
jgi:hypothetical protein